MSKLTLTDPTSLSNEASFLAQLASNNLAVETSMENTLSRDGTSPNHMLANLDMNSQRIINLVAAVADEEPVRKAEFDTLSDTVADLEVAVASFGSDQIPGLGDPDADRILFWDNSAGDSGQGRVQYLSLGTGLSITGTVLDVAPSIGLVDSVFARTGDVVAASGDYTASQVTNVPAGGVAAVTVQAAITELDTEKLAASSYTAADVLTKLLTVDGAGSGLDADLLDGNSSAFYSPATVSGTAAAILVSLLTVDGAGSGLDADLLDGNSSVFFATATGLSDHLADTADAHDASAISNVAAGNIVATDVQAAINELDTEKLAASSYTAADVLTKLLTVDGAGSGLDADLLDGSSSAAFGLVANPLSQFAATTSFQLLNTISDNTGTGALVFATSPTLVTPLLGTPTSGVLTNATGLPIDAGTINTLPVNRGGTGQTTEAEALGEMIQALTADASPDGAADYVVTYDASADTGKKVLLDDLPGGGGGSDGVLSDVKVYTASDTWTKPAGLVAVLVKVIGAGGGGGGGDGTGLGAVGGAAGGGGGAGGYAEEYIVAASLGATETVTIGAAGTAGSNAGGTGGTGGTSSFGALLQSTGGVGGTGTGSNSTSSVPRAGGAGGVGSSADVNANGAPGGISISAYTGDFVTNNLWVNVGGNGGSSLFGGGGLGAIHTGTTATAGGAATNYGSGGGGAAANNTTGAAGGAGTAGLILVYEYVA